MQKHASDIVFLLGIVALPELLSNAVVFIAVNVAWSLQYAVYAAKKQRKPIAGIFKFE